MGYTGYFYCPGCVGSRRMSLRIGPFARCEGSKFGVHHWTWVGFRNAL